MSINRESAESRILAVRGALPEHGYPQDVITSYIEQEVLQDPRLREVLPDPTQARDLLRRFHHSAQVRSRHLALPLESYRDLGFGAANDVYLDVAVRLSAQAASEALAAAGLGPESVDLIVLASSTGIATPSLDSRLIPELGLREDVKRLPLFGLGCVAGAAGIARVHDYLVGHPDEVALLVTVELPSLTFQRADPSIANLVASGLFGDGAAAVVMAGGETAPTAATLASVLATRSRYYPATERVMGWDVTDAGFSIVLDPRVPEVVRTYLRDDVDGFLGLHGLDVADISTWVAHPGGPKVLEAMTETLDVPADAFDVTWQCLSDIGNISSSSVLHVLERTLQKELTEAGTPGLMTALGPGFCSELVLLRW